MRATVPQRTARIRTQQRSCRTPRRRTTAQTTYTPACRGEDVALFDEDELVLFAVALCRECRLQPACLDYALRHDVTGVWGGTTGAERVELRRQRGLPDPAPLSWYDAEPLTFLYAAAS